MYGGITFSLLILCESVKRSKEGRESGRIDAHFRPMDLTFCGLDGVSQALLCKKGEYFSSTLQSVPHMSLSSTTNYAFESVRSLRGSKGRKSVSKTFRTIGGMEDYGLLQRSSILPGRTALAVLILTTLFSMVWPISYWLVHSCRGAE